MSLSHCGCAAQPPVHMSIGPQPSLPSKASVQIGLGFMLRCGDTGRLSPSPHFPPSIRNIHRAPNTKVLALVICLSAQSKYTGFYCYPECYRLDLIYLRGKVFRSTLLNPLLTEEVISNRLKMAGADCCCARLEANGDCVRKPLSSPFV